MHRSLAHASVADIIAPRRDETIIGLLQANVAAHPDKPFVIFPDHDEYRMSYAAALQGAEGIARALRNIGLKPGARVAIFIANSPEFIWAWMGTQLAAAVDVPISVGTHGASLSYALNKARVDVVITNHGGLSGLATATDVALAPQVVLIESGECCLTQAPVRLSWADRASADKASHIDVSGQAAEFKPANPLHMGSIRYTSGSTGFPKGVMMSQAHAIANGRMYGHLSGYTSDDVLYSCFPVHHVFSSCMGVLSTLVYQGTMVLAQKFSASKFWDHVRRFDVTISQILDAPATILMSNPESELDRQHKCRTMYTTTTAMPRFEERFGVKILGLFDMSELTAISWYPPGVERREGSCGLPSGLFDIAILDDDDYEVPTGTEGQIAVRPLVPHVMMMGYFDDSPLVVERWSNLWYHCNDRGYFDKDGFLYFTGRLGDRIRRRGVNISAAEIENAAQLHRDVAEAAVIGVPDALGEDEIKLCVVLKPGHTVEHKGLMDHLKRDLPKSSVPRYIEIRASFPRTETEKIRKNVLRDEGDHGLTATTWDAATGEMVQAVAKTAA